MTDDRIYLEPRSEYDRAIVGTMFGSGSVCYAIGVVLDVLQKQGMSYAEAKDWFCFNMSDAYIGIGSPVYIDLE